MGQWLAKPMQKNIRPPYNIIHIILYIRICVCIEKNIHNLNLKDNTCELNKDFKVNLANNYILLPP